MADSKDCPACGLVNPPSAQRCDCGYDFAARRMLGSFISGNGLGSLAGCQGCGVDAETRYVSFHRNIGAFLLRLHTSVEGQFCKSCINRHFWTMTATTLFLGWWGVISFFFTPFILMNNIGRYLSCLGMKSPPKVGSSQMTRPGGTGPVAQLVGQNCVHCGERISCELDGRFCRSCGSPIHDKCTRPGNATGCSTCGAAVPIP